MQDKLGKKVHFLQIKEKHANKNTFSTGSCRQNKFAGGLILYTDITNVYAAYSEAAPL